MFVTHDQAEALAIADVIAIMRDGRIVQSGIPDDVYASPIDPWVARFLGDAISLTAKVKNGSVATVLGTLGTSLPTGVMAEVMIRPEWISPHLAPEGKGRIVDRVFYGHDQLVEIELPGGHRVEALVPTANRMGVGDRVDIEVIDSIIFAQ